MGKMEDAWQTKRLVEMIRITLQNEPQSFSQKVREKGTRWLSEQGIPPDRNCPQEFWKNRDYWTSCYEDLHDLYDGVCAYSCFLVGPDGGTVDHYEDKGTRPTLAYEWSNYRLAAFKINSRKGASKDVIDPLLVPKDAFFLDVITGRIYPNDDLKMPILQTTIDRLRLDAAIWRKHRLRWIEAYERKEFTKEGLRRNAPFIYAELDRQKLL